MQVVISLLLGALLGVLVGGAGALWVVAQRLRQGRSLPGDMTERLTVKRIVTRNPSDDWFRGDDLLRYPRRLGELQHRLVEQHQEALDQAGHLHARRAELSGRDDRQALAQRYADDAGLLARRAERMARVLGVVWKTRALLVLRAHVAITARRRPQIEGLPDAADVPVGQLDAVGLAYDRASDAVRAFVDELDSRANDLEDFLPEVPEAAIVTDDVAAEVAAEKDRTLATYTEMRSRMDTLADTLAYLADRCRTRAVVEGGPGAVDTGPGSEALADELNAALAGLSELAEVGDRKLADAAMDNLAEDISQLEQAGLDAQAETDAVLEVERLLAQFPDGSKG